MKYGYYSRRAVLLNLMSGDLHAYVQDQSIGAWYRIPKCYWVSPSTNIESEMDRPYLPETLEKRSHISIQNDDAIVGQPIVVWQNDIERLAEILHSSGAEMLEADHVPDNQAILSNVNDRIHGALTPVIKKRGPPHRYDWNGALAAVADHDNLNDVISDIVADRTPQSALENFVKDWFASRDRYPSPTSVRSRVAGMVQHRRELTARKGQ